VREAREVTLLRKRTFMFLTLFMVDGFAATSFHREGREAREVAFLKTRTLMFLTLFTVDGFPAKSLTNGMLRGRRPE
jgi:hypothetical protein